MCINKDEIPDRRAIFLAHKRFINNLGIMVVRDSFCVGFYEYAKPGSLSGWIVVFKVACGTRYKIQSVVEAIDAASQKSPIFLSRRENSDRVASIRLKTDVNKKIPSGILLVMIPDGTHPTYTDTTGSKKFLYSDIQRLIMQGGTFNNENKLSLISDMRQFNICVNNDTRKFYLYWKAAIRAMETEGVHGSHERIHDAGGSDATNRISHYPFIYTNHIIKSTIYILEKDGLNQVVDFKFPSKSWLSLQSTSNNGQQRTSERYTVQLPFVCDLQLGSCAIITLVVITMQR